MNKPFPKQAYHQQIISSIHALLLARDNINYKNIRWGRWRYMLIFSLAPVFANMQDALFKTDLRLLGLDAMTLMGCAYCIGAGVIFAFSRQENMAAVARMSAFLTLAGFIPWMLMGEGALALACAILFTFGLGGCAACASFTYTFALNNAERFLGAALISLFFALNQLDVGLGIVSGWFDKAYLTAIVIGTVVCLTMYKTGDYADQERSPQATMNPPLYLMLYFFVAHYLVEIFYTYLPGTSVADAQIANGLVGILAVGLAVAMQLFAKRSVWHMCNLFFVAIIGTYALYFMPEGSGGREVGRFLHGFEQMGYLAAYYLLGCVFKKYGNFRLFRLCLIVILPASMVCYAIPGAICAYAPGLLLPTATCVSVLIFMVFVLLSPAYARYLFSAPWAEDFRRVDMTGTEPQFNPLAEPDQEQFDLTVREKEVASFLLQGSSAKQIADQLNISVNTVNFHIKNLYKKLNISSRAELFSRFSVREKAGNNYHDWRLP